MDNSETNRNNNKNNEKILLKRIKTMKEKKVTRTKTIQPKEVEADKISISIYTNKYNKPIIDSKQKSSSIIINQHIPTSTAFRLEPTRVICPYCKNDIISEVEESFNCCTCLLYFVIVLLCAIPCLFCSGLCNNNCYCVNDIGCGCCCDATHKCPKCKKVIGFHESFPNCC